MSELIESSEIATKLLAEKEPKIIWLRSLGKHNEPEVNFAHVESIKDNYINVVWYEGHKKLNDTISEKEVLAIEDKKTGSEIVIGGYTGKGVLTQYGQDYINEQNKEEKKSKNKLK